MNGLLDVTAATLGNDLGFEVPEIYVVIAKHSVLGMSSESIRDMLGCETAELEEIEKSQEYKSVRLYIAGRNAQMSVDQTSGWDQIENISMQNLIKRLPFEKDGDFLLRVAAVANKAQRRHQTQTGILDPAIRTGRTVITLTQRLTQRLNGSREAEVTETRELSISDGSMGNPSFDEVDSLLSVTGRPVLSKDIAIRTRTAEPDLDELSRFMDDM